MIFHNTGHSRYRKFERTNKLTLRLWFFIILVFVTKSADSVRSWLLWCQFRKIWDQLSLQSRNTFVKMVTLVRGSFFVQLAYLFTLQILIPRVHVYLSEIDVSKNRSSFIIEGYASMSFPSIQRFVQCDSSLKYRQIMLNLVRICKQSA